MKEKVVLAYSGGLDTTAIIPWLKENFDYDYLRRKLRTGREAGRSGREQRPAALCRLYIEDVIDEFCDDYIVPCIIFPCRIREQVSVAYFHGKTPDCQEAGRDCQKKRCCSYLPRCYR